MRVETLSRAPHLGPLAVPLPLLFRLDAVLEDREGQSSDESEETEPDSDEVPED